MTISSEIWLMIAIIGLYLYDSALLVFTNEVLLIPSRKARWSVHFGSSNFGVGGRELFVPNPLTFHRPIYRLSWSYQSDGLQPRLNFGAETTQFWPVVPMLWGLAIGLFVILPLGLFSPFGDEALLAGLAMIFGNIATAIAWISARRAHLNLSWRRIGSLAFESIVCPPFALNLIRHISLGKCIPEDAILVAHQVCDADMWQQVRTKLLAKIEDEMDLEPEDSERYRILIARRNNLPQGKSACQD